MTALDEIVPISQQEVEMIRSTAHLKRFSLMATDGLIGSVADFLFDDDNWVIRYVVVDTGKWLPGRKVLITPLSIQGVEWGEQRMLLSISRDQVRNSPAYDTHRPVSRQHEIDYFNHYGYPYYWGYAGLWGPAAYPRLSKSGYERQEHPEAASERARAVARGDGHLEAPAYDRAEHVDRQWEAAYYSHLGAPGYWVEPEDARTHRPHERHLSE